MTKDEALRMAIEAMEYHTEQTRPIEDTDKTIQACKDALAEGELDAVRIEILEADAKRLDWVQLYIDNALTRDNIDKAMRYARAIEQELKAKNT